MSNITSLLPNECLGQLVTLSNMPKALKVLSGDLEADGWGQWQQAQWSIAISTWLMSHGKTECVWLYTPSETVYSEADWWQSSLTKALSDWENPIETWGEWDYTVDLPNGYLCIHHACFVWRGTRYRALILGNGDGGASALADYFIIEA